jgi:DNA-binding IclR family transcriptional regulator
LPALDDILELLEDGKWHNLKETAEKHRLPKSKLERILGFLAQYKFIILNTEHQKAKLNPTMLKFIKETRTLEKKNILTS